jgi:uncharacterized membrane protein YphA (DoxX/SURF4 family)
MLSLDSAADANFTAFLLGYAARFAPFILINILSIVNASAISEASMTPDYE